MENNYEIGKPLIDKFVAGYFCVLERADWLLQQLGYTFTSVRVVDVDYSGITVVSSYYEDETSHTFPLEALIGDDWLLQEIERREIEERLREVERVVEEERRRVTRQAERLRIYEEVRREKEREHAEVVLRVESMRPAITPGKYCQHGLSFWNCPYGC